MEQEKQNRINDAVKVVRIGQIIIIYFDTSSLHLATLENWEIFRGGGLEDQMSWLPVTGKLN